MTSVTRVTPPGHPCGICHIAAIGVGLCDYCHIVLRPKGRKLLCGDPPTVATRSVLYYCLYGSGTGEVGLWFPPSCNAYKPFPVWAGWGDPVSVTTSVTLSCDRLTLQTQHRPKPLHPVTVTSPVRGERGTP